MNMKIDIKKIDNKYIIIGVSVLLVVLIGLIVYLLKGKAPVEEPAVSFSSSSVTTSMVLTEKIETEPVVTEPPMFEKAVELLQLNSEIGRAHV